MRYAVVIEKADGNYSAYVPDLPGCGGRERNSRGDPVPYRRPANRWNRGSAADQHRRIRRNVKQKTTKSLPQSLR